MMIDVAGLLATAVLLFTLIGLEFGRVGADRDPRSSDNRRPPRHAARPRFAPSHVLPSFAAVAGAHRRDGRHQRPYPQIPRTAGGVLVDLAGTVSRRGLAIMWVLYLILVLPRVMGLLL